MIVVDAEVLISLTLVRPHTPVAREAFLRDPDWAAPPLWRSDFRGQLWKHIAANRISEAQAHHAFDAAERVIAGNEPDPALSEIVRLVRTHGIEPYDAEYVAIARDLGVRYVTADLDLAKACPETVISISVFAEGPASRV